MNAPRSKSVPATRGVFRDTEQKEDHTPFPPLPQEPISDSRVPSWISELASAGPGRQSRASSVVSTRTRFSTTTFDDARSIDIQAGGQTFRISRFGDRITDTTAPPPYSGLNNDDLLIHRLDDIPPGDADERLFHEHGFGHARQNHHFHHHHQHHHGDGRRQRRRVRIAMPDEDDTEPPNNGESAATPSRIITDEELRQIILDLPSRLQMALGMDRTQQQALPTATAQVTSITSTIETSAFDTPRPGHKESSPDEGKIPNERQISSTQVRGILRNATQSAPCGTGSEGLDHNESRRFPFQNVFWNTYKNAKGSRDLNDISNERGTDPCDASESSQLLQEISVPPTVGDLNELSQIYNKVIRELDHEHRKQLHAKDKELDQVRILLHEKDVVFRQQLKRKDFTIEDLENRLNRLEKSVEQRIERAAHEVEDIWELRWKEHSEQLMEKCGLVKPVMPPYSTSSTQTDS